MIISTIFFAFILGGLGGTFRYTVDIVISKNTKIDFPISTLFINISGTLLLFLALHLQQFENFSTYLFLFFGGYTTFSRFNLELFLMFEKLQTKKAIVYLLISFIPMLFISYLNIY